MLQGLNTERRWRYRRFSDSHAQGHHPRSRWRGTEGVEYRKDKDVIDEIPMAYTDIDAVMRAQEDLVEVVHTKGGAVAKRAFDAMMPMKKIDVTAIEAAVRG